mmetsp:Transcript_18932/g.54244  ORF Transcript_18932/g.54244 Transcript_18932/m.54244 type:complete len:253 (-) Transcript_18932:767-1525(-)
MEGRSLWPEPAVGHGTGGGVVRWRQDAAPGEAHRHRGGRGIHLRPCADERLVGEGHPEVGVRAAGALRREELRHNDLPLGRDLGRLGALPLRNFRRGAGRPGAVGLLARPQLRIVRHRLGGGPHHAVGRGDDHHEVELPAHVLEHQAAARAPQRHRLQHAARGFVGQRHDLRHEQGQLRVDAGADMARRGGDQALGRQHTEIPAGLRHLEHPRRMQRGWLAEDRLWRLLRADLASWFVRHYGPGSRRGALAV